MKLYGEVMRDVADAEIGTWRLDEPFALHRPMQRITLRVIMRAIFGMEGERGDALERQLVAMLDNGQGAAMVPFLQHSFGGHGPWARAEAASEAVDAAIFEEIARRRAGEGGGDDILSMLLDARDAGGNGLTDEELRDELITLLVAGHETTATALAWALERLARHPDAWERLRSEDEDYLDAVVKETLRLRPVVPIVLRLLKAPMEIAGYRLPAGVAVAPNILLMHTRADVYPEPRAFRPERFLQTPAGTYTWIPFGGGVRRCLGASFAIFEMKAVLRAIAAGIDRLAPDRSASERVTRRAVTLVPARDARVIAAPRTTTAPLAPPVPTGRSAPT
jgi:cytochrome P450